MSNYFKSVINPERRHYFEVIRYNDGFNGIGTTIELKPSGRKLPLNHCYNCINF